MDFDDDFDPEMHTAEEIRAHFLARYDADPVFRLRVDELAEMIASMDTQQRGLEQLQQDDPVGMVWFGDDDQWVDSRLSRKDQEQ
jgi:hypothetical protein